MSSMAAVYKEGGIGAEQIYTMHSSTVEHAKNTRIRTSKTTSAWQRIISTQTHRQREVGAVKPAEGGAGWDPAGVDTRLKTSTDSNGYNKIYSYGLKI